MSYKYREYMSINIYYIYRDKTFKKYNRKKYVEF